MDMPRQVKDVEEAIELYLAAFREQFTGVHGAYRRRYALSRFLGYLRGQNHSLNLIDLKFEDGQEFLDSLHNAYTGAPITRAIKKQYKSALRSFSRFLLNTGLVKSDLFFTLEMQ